MAEAIKLTIMNSWPILKASFFAWVREKHLFILQKRFLVVFGFLFLFSFINGYSQKSSQGQYIESTSKIVAKIEDMQKKIKAGSGWTPLGQGDNVELVDLPKISAGAVLDVESGNVLWSQNLNERIPPASLSKLGVVITALDVWKLDQTVTVDRNASNQVPTKLGLAEGERLTLEEAISAGILTSANDAMEAIASSIGGSLGGGTADFMRLVNYKLTAVGAKNSNFVNATGLDDPMEYSTVYDLAIIGREAYKNYPLIAKVGSVEYMRLNKNSGHKVFDLPNWNALLGTYPGVDGLKIGYTEKAGNTTMVTAKRDGVNLMAIVIGASSIETRETAAAALLNYGFSKHNIEAYPVEELDLIKRFEDWRRQLSYASN